MSNDIIEVEKTLVYHEPQQGILMDAALAALETAKGVLVDSPGAYEAWAGELVSLKRTIKDIEDLRKKLKQPFLDGGRAIDDIFKGPLNTRAEAATTIERALTAYRQKAEAERREAQRKLDEAAERERKRLLEEAAALAKVGKEEAAVKAAAQAAVTFPATVDAPVVKAAGTHSRKRWVARMVNLPEFLSYVAAHPELHECVEVKQGKLDALASAYHLNLSIPGVVAEEVESTVARS